MTTHELKIRKEYADAKAKGVKSFELREDDRGYAVDDRVTYRTVDELGNELAHGLDGKEFEIVYILKGFTRGLKRNWVIWQEKELPRDGGDDLSLSRCATAPSSEGALEDAMSGGKAKKKG